MFIASSTHTMANPVTRNAIATIERRERLARIERLRRERIAAIGRQRVAAVRERRLAALDAAAAHEAVVQDALRRSMVRYARFVARSGDTLTLADFIQAEAGMPAAVAERLRQLSESDIIGALRANQHVPIARVLARVERATGVSRHDIRGPSRRRQVCFARQMFFYWAVRLCRRSYPAVGRYAGGRDHTTVLHGVDVYVAKRALQGRSLRPLSGRAR